VGRERGQEQAQQARQQVEGGSAGSEQPTRTQPQQGGSYRAT
jgi:hypothetical protein